MIQYIKNQPNLGALKIELDGEFNISLKLKTGEGQEWLKANDMIQVRKALKQDLSSIIDWDKADQNIHNGFSN